MNCIRLLGGWASDGEMVVDEDACIWDETQQVYVYRLWKVIDRIDGVLSKGYEIHQLVLDNPPWCFQRGLTFSADPGPGEYDEAHQIATYGNAMPPGEPQAWNDFIRALMNELLQEYGQAHMDQWRFRVATEADYYPHHWAGTKMDYFEHYANTVDAVHAVLPSAKVAAHFLSPASGSNRYGTEFVTWCDQNNIPCDFIGVTYYPFYNKSNHVDMDRIYRVDFKPFVDAPGWQPHMRLEIPEYSLFTEKDDDGYNMGVGTSHNPAFVTMMAKMLHGNSIINVHNWGNHYDDPVFLALEGMLAKDRYAGQKAGSPNDPDNKIDGIFAIGGDRTSVDVMIFNYNADPAYIADETVNLSFTVPLPAGTVNEYRIAVCDQANNPHYQFVQEYPLAGLWESEGGWVINRINPGSTYQTDKNGLLDQILITTGKNLWNSKKSTYPGYKSLVWSDWNPITTSAGSGSGSTLELTIPLSSFSFQKIEFRTDTAADVSIHYPLDGDVTEAGGSGLDGTLVDGSFAPSLVQHDQGLILDGVDDYAEVPGYKGITGSASRTCSAWIKTTAVSGEIISWGSEPNNGARWIIRVNEGGQLRAEVQGGNIIGTTVISDGLWHHIAVVLEDDGSPDINEAQLYVDGQLEAISASVAEPINTGSDQNVQVGVHEVGQRYFQGRIDDVRIYSYALTEAEVQALALITLPTPDIVDNNFIDLADVSALAAYWLSGDCFSNNLCNGRDLNADQVVNQSDFSVLSQLWLSPIDLPLVTLVDDFDSYAVDTVMNNQTSPGPLGGLWDSDDEGTWHSTRAGKVILDGTNQVVYQEYRSSGRRTLCVNGLSDSIDEGETGALFFRFKAMSTTNPISWYAGVHELTGSDPLTVSSADETGKLVAGFHAVSAGGSTFDIKSVDDSAILLTGLSQDQWYSVWMVVNHDLDTFDLFIEEAADGAGEVGLLTATAVGSGLPFEISTTNAMTGGLWHQAGGNSSNMIFDEVAWSGNVPPQLPGTYGNDGLPWAISATAATRIEAENYNIGGEGVSYHDTTAENAGGAYRIEDVDIQATTDVGVGYNVSHIAADEWLEYSVDVAKRGIYELNLRTARLLDGNSSIRVLFDGQDKTGTLSVPSTDDWQTFTDTKKVVGLSAGRQIMRVEFLAGSQNLNWIELTYVGPNPDFLAPVGVGLEDFAHLAGYWLQSGCSMAGNDGCDGADLEDSGTVDIGDLQQLVNQWLENPLNTIQ